MVDLQYGKHLVDISDSTLSQFAYAACAHEPQTGTPPRRYLIGSARARTQGDPRRTQCLSNHQGDFRDGQLDVGTKHTRHFYGQPASFLLVTRHEAGYVYDGDDGNTHCRAQLQMAFYFSTSAQIKGSGQLFIL